MHIDITPPILYFGTPVVLISTLNPDGTANLAPMSSAWALGWTVMLGLAREGQTIENLERAGECVLNLPHDELWQAVERLAPLTGREVVPEFKRAYGARHEPRKFEAAGLTPVASRCVGPPRVAECPLQLEARVREVRGLADDPSLACVEARVVAVHADERLMANDRRHVLPTRWRPLIYNFRHYHGVGSELGRSFRSAVPPHAG